ncbi:hypothetical protein Dimus_025158 [Dionaea muscipula]
MPLCRGLQFLDGSWAFASWAAALWTELMLAMENCCALDVAAWWAAPRPGGLLLLRFVIAASCRCCASMGRSLTKWAADLLEAAAVRTACCHFKFVVIATGKLQMGFNVNDGGLLHAAVRYVGYIHGGLFIVVLHLAWWATVAALCNCRKLPLLCFYGPQLNKMSR